MFDLGYFLVSLYFLFKCVRACGSSQWYFQNYFHYFIMLGLYSATVVFPELFSLFKFLRAVFCECVVFPELFSLVKVLWAVLCNCGISRIISFS